MFLEALVTIHPRACCVHWPYPEALPYQLYEEVAYIPVLLAWLVFGATVSEVAARQRRAHPIGVGR